MRLKFTRFLIRFLLRLLTRVEVRGRENIPVASNFIIAANHNGLVDAFLPFYIINNTNLVLLVGEKWEKLSIMRWLGRGLNFLFIDRFNPDLKAIREVIARMKHGEVLVITPEGTRSKVGCLIEGKPGVSYLAAKMGYPLAPVGISGTFDKVFFGQLKRLHRPHIIVSIGPAFSLPPLPKEAQDRDKALKTDTDEIMCRIAALLPQEQRGVYSDHPRLKELLENPL
ncbi:MAG: lysophospholipid acyltransferase family protein [Chloroflexi bacterium]|nr:1-acyl-sn-glycerol-3-phosphate acyltransferase [Chloroflexota bacterium]MCX6037252.1 lysophospholipid acyltransferase family protein [Chloroflexota bacterium]